MKKHPIPFFCNPRIRRQQTHCPHLHTSFRGGFHFSSGEVWDDLTEVCDDCGANLDELPSPRPPSNQEEALF